VQECCNLFGTAALASSRARQRFDARDLLAIQHFSDPRTAISGRESVAAAPMVSVVRSQHASPRPPDGQLPIRNEGPRRLTHSIGEGRVRWRREVLNEQLTCLPRCSRGNRGSLAAPQEPQASSVPSLREMRHEKGCVNPPCGRWCCQWTRRATCSPEAHAARPSALGHVQGGPVPHHSHGMTTLFAALDVAAGTVLSASTATGATKSSRSRATSTRGPHPATTPIDGG
jgi:hypothetical protein